MPYHFHLEDCGVIVKFYGIFCFKDNNEATIQLYTHPKFSDFKYIIWDFSGVSEMNMTNAETDVASMMDKEASKRLPNTKVVLITKNEFTKVLCEEYIAQCHNRKLTWEFMLSDNIEAAMSWIDS